MLWHENEMKPQSLASPDVYKHCNYPAIHRYDDQAFDDMSEESEKKTFLLRNRCGLFQVKAFVEQAKKNGELRPQTVMWPRIA